jgi:nitrogen-specific signal transduction histidine kinase
VRAADPRHRSSTHDSGVGGRLVERLAQQLGGQVEWESGNKRTIVCLTLPSREVSYDLGAPGCPS